MIRPDLHLADFTARNVVQEPIRAGFGRGLVPGVRIRR